MGFRSWLYKTTGIQLKKLEVPAHKEIKQLEKEIEALKKQMTETQEYLGFCKQYVPALDTSYEVKDEFKTCLLSNAAIQKLIEDYTFQTVVDIGAGAGEHSRLFRAHGKEVTEVDFGVSVYYQQHVADDGQKFNKIIGDFNKINFDTQYDCTWCSHILEHQPNVEMFIKKVVSITKEGGVIAITIPPFKHEIVGGHISVWNAGLVLYRLVLAGIDCSNAAVLSYGYNISIIVQKRTIDLQGIEYDCGDIRKIKPYLPANLEFHSNEHDDPFNGNIARLNW